MSSRRLQEQEDAKKRRAVRAVSGRPSKYAQKRAARVAGAKMVEQEPATTLEAIPVVGVRCPDCREVPDQVCAYHRVEQRAPVARTIPLEVHPGEQPLTEAQRTALIEGLARSFR